jgi:hypothetical protein
LFFENDHHLCDKKGVETESIVFRTTEDECQALSVAYSYKRWGERIYIKRDTNKKQSKMADPPTTAIAEGAVKEVEEKQEVDEAEDVKAKAAKEQESEDTEKEETVDATNVEAVKPGDLPNTAEQPLFDAIQPACHIVHQLSISNWRMNGTWMGTFLNLSYNYYVTAVRALIRAPNMPTKTKKGDVNLIGLVIEAFGFWDLRSAHSTTVYRQAAADGALIQLEPFTWDYPVCTTTYKLCRLWFRESDFLPKHSYFFQYNGRRDYEWIVFLENLISMDELFATAQPYDAKTILPPSNPLEWDDAITLRVKADRESGKWGNPNSKRAPYGPMGM